MDEIGNLVWWVRAVKHHLGADKTMDMIEAAPNPTVMLRGRFAMINRKLDAVIARIQKLEMAAKEGNAKKVLALLEENFDYQVERAQLLTKETAN